MNQRTACKIIDKLGDGKWSENYRPRKQTVINAVKKDFRYLSSGYELEKLIRYYCALADYKYKIKKEA